MRRPLLRTVLTVLTAALLSLPAPAVRAFDDDDPAKIWKELVEKIEKAFKHAAEAQRKAALKAEKRAREEKEDVTEAQQKARAKAEKDAKEAAHRDAEARKDLPKLEEQALDEMEDRVEDYVKTVRKPAVKQAGERPPQATPDQNLTPQRALATAIRALRTGAKQGDLIVPEAQPIVKRIIA